MKQVVLSQEMKEKIVGCYLIFEDTMVRLGEVAELTPENFKAYWLDEDDVWQELCADDFTWDGSDKDYVYKDKGSYRYCLTYEEVPEEVTEFLDAVIEKRIQAAQEGGENE